MLQLHYRKNYDFDTPPVTFCHCSRRNPSPPPHCNHLCHLFLPRRARTKKAIANMQKLSTFVSFFFKKKQTRKRRYKHNVNILLWCFWILYGEDPWCYQRLSLFHNPHTLPPCHRLSLFSYPPPPDTLANTIIVEWPLF